MDERTFGEAGFALLCIRLSRVDDHLLGFDYTRWRLSCFATSSATRDTSVTSDEWELETDVSTVFEKYFR